MLFIRINDTLVLDGSGFISLFNENAPHFVINKSNLIPRIVDDNYIVWYGYKINVKSIIFKDAKSSDLTKGFNLIIDSTKNEYIFKSFFKGEIYNYYCYLCGFDAYYLPSIEFLKLCYWFYMCSQILKSQSKLLQIKKEILGKSRVLNSYSRTSEAFRAYENLLNSTSDFYSELMFAVLSHKFDHDVSFNKSNDFVIDNNIAEVKSIHDKFDMKILDKDSSSMLRKSLPDSFCYEDMLDTISQQITRKKWIYHLKTAIKKQEAKIILFNGTQSQQLQAVSIFIEEKELRKSFEYTLAKCIPFINNDECIPVLVILENIHQYHTMSFFCFLVPVIDKNSNPELDLSNYNTSYLKDKIFL
jgi:hypothetical protein